MPPSLANSTRLPVGSCLLTYGDQMTSPTRALRGRPGRLGPGTFPVLGEVRSAAPPRRYCRLTRNSCQGSLAVFSVRMGTKAQHADPYQALPPFLRSLRKGAGLTQRELGDRLDRPQSWVYNCESANRRVDVTEFIAWTIACGVDPRTAFLRFLKAR